MLAYGYLWHAKRTAPIYPLLFSLGTDLRTDLPTPLLSRHRSTHSTPPLVAHGTTSTTGPSFAPPPPVHHHRPCISLSPNTVHEICQAGFKIHHNYVEDFSLGAWQALRNTWKGPMITDGDRAILSLKTRRRKLAQHEQKDFSTCRWSYYRVLQIFFGIDVYSVGLWLCGVHEVM
ncbi:hypothetical protein LguiA_014036 [Lonicera macranthoides]